MGWFDCDRTCRDTGKIMLCIENEVQNSYFHEDRVWLGYRRVGDEWKWDLGCVSTYANWAAGEGSDGNFARKWWGTDLWYDADYDWNAQCVCQTSDLGTDLADIWNFMKEIL